jgi:putative restriction endonuclease
MSSPDYTLDPEVVLDRIRKLGVWERHGQRAPNKPLMLLVALARLANGESRLMPFEEIRPRMKLLLKEFGPPRGTVGPEYPFFWLTSDGIWEVPGSEGLRRRGTSAIPLTSELVRHKVSAGFIPGVFNAFAADKNLVQAAARSLLDSHFPQSMHSEILEAVGLTIDPELPIGRLQDPAFRAKVIRAYEHRCAICSFEVTMEGGVDLGLEAAHIKWRQAGGPDLVRNGLALCSLHHKALDLGGIGLSDELTLLVSEELRGHIGFDDAFLRFKGRQIRSPRRDEDLPQREFLAWHRSQVFRTPARG